MKRSILVVLMMVACGFLIRVAKATIERTEIKCGSCGSPFAVG